MPDEDVHGRRKHHGVREAVVELPKGLAFNAATIDAVFVPAC